MRLHAACARLGLTGRDQVSPVSTPRWSAPSPRQDEWGDRGVGWVIALRENCENWRKPAKTLRKPFFGLRTIA